MAFPSMDLWDRLLQPECGECQDVTNTEQCMLRAWRSHWPLPFGSCRTEHRRFMSSSLLVSAALMPYCSWLPSTWLRAPTEHPVTAKSSTLLYHTRVHFFPFYLHYPKAKPALAPTGTMEKRSGCNI